MASPESLRFVVICSLAAALTILLATALVKQKAPDISTALASFAHVRHVWLLLWMALVLNPLLGPKLSRVCAGMKDFCISMATNYCDPTSMFHSAL